MADFRLGEFEFNQLLAVRAACETAIRSIDTMMGMINAQAEEEQQQLVKADPKTCKHPRNKIRAAAVMGKPNRAMCGVCDAELEITR